jgi:hypothetical protein
MVRLRELRPCFSWRPAELSVLNFRGEKPADQALAHPSWDFTPGELSPKGLEASPVCGPIEGHLSLLCGPSCPYRREPGPPGRGDSDAWKGSEVERKDREG